MMTQLRQAWNLANYIKILSTVHRIKNTLKHFPYYIIFDTWTLNSAEVVHANLNGGWNGYRVIEKVQGNNNIIYLKHKLKIRD